MTTSQKDKQEQAAKAQADVDKQVAEANERAAASTVTTARSVLERRPGTNVFTDEDPEGTLPEDSHVTRFVLKVTDELLADLGNPQQITIIVEPGDTLNGDES